MEPTIFKLLLKLFQQPKTTIGIAVLMLSAYSMLKNRYMKKRAGRTETLQKLIDFYENYAGEQKNFFVEQLFYNHFGVLISYSELKFFLSSDKPSFFIQQYLHGREFLQLSADKSRIEIKPTVKLSCERYKGIALYGVSGMGAAMLLLNSYDAFISIGPELYVPWVLLTLALLAFAWLGIDLALRAGTAEKLCRELES